MVSMKKNIENIIEYFIIEYFLTLENMKLNYFIVVKYELIIMKVNKRLITN